MSKIDHNIIGVDRKVRDPRRALERVEGVYKDIVYKLPAVQRYPNAVSLAPNPTPFVRR